MKKFRFIINPVAGHGKAPRYQKLIRSYSHSDHLLFEITLTEYAGHAAILAAEAARENYYAVVAVGGDGTVNEVAGSITETSTALGILPAGSGNGLARHLGISMDPAEALRQLVNGTIIHSDTLSINNRLSVNVSGIGFDGYVAWLFNHAGKRGLSTYTAVALKAYRAYQPAHFTFHYEKEVISMEAHMLVIANASQFGNKAIIAPKARIDDGQVNCVFVRKPPFYKLPGLFLRLFTGKLKDDTYLRNITCMAFEVRTSRPMHLHIDGESLEPADLFRVKVHPASLLVIGVTR